ncbi:MAG: hypothetical protein K2X55_00960, partial [Burkholderiaceae bacterium]|nr:hypothetical protein [Burkholderiaceae bacterium]
MEYVTFDPATGVLTGGYTGQEPVEGESFIEVPAEQRATWTAYRANEARDGLDLLPPFVPTEPPVPAVPNSVTRRQARQALLLAGLLDDVQTAIDGIADETQRRLAQIEWEDSLEFKRDRPLVISIGTALGLNA